MIYHYFDPWQGVQYWHCPQTETSPTWTTTPVTDKTKLGKISVVKSDTFTTLIVRDKSQNIMFVVDLTKEEAASLVERLKNADNS